MESGQKAAAERVESGLLLAIDACGPTGSVALGRIIGRSVEILGEIELEGRSYSSTLVSAVGDLLKGAGVGLKDLGAIVAVNGPGSFTGVRIGLSAIKGLAEVSRISVAVVSRLEVLAAKAGVDAAALDAHRGEVFLRIASRARGQRDVEHRTDGSIEMLAGAAELKAIDPAPAQVAVCDDAGAALLAAAWPSSELLRPAPPTAADALRLVSARVSDGALGDFALADLVLPDLALLDGNYLRRSDAEIFGEATEARRG